MKKTITLKTLMLVLVALFSINASAYDYTFSAENAEGKTIYYKYDSTWGVLEVTKGEIKYAGNVIIPEEVKYLSSVRKVTSIGTSAFSNCSDLSYVTIPGTVTEIKDYAFQMCSNLASIEIPNSVTRIGKSAFTSCI